MKQVCLCYNMVPAYFCNNDLKIKKMICSNSPAGRMSSERYFYRSFKDLYENP